jgi:6-phosphogluconate dehydrogenase (decarboxylating)
MKMTKYGWMGFLKMGNFGMGKFIDMIEMGFYREY